MELPSCLYQNKQTIYEWIYFWIFQSTQFSVYIRIVLKVRKCKFSNFILFKYCFGCFKSFVFLYKFQNQFANSNPNLQKRPAEILIEMALNLQLNEELTNILTTLSFPINNMIFVRFSIFYLRYVLRFRVELLYIFSGFAFIVNDSFSDFIFQLLQVCRNINDFSILTLLNL